MRDQSTSVAAQLLVTEKDRCEKKRKELLVGLAFPKATGSRDSPFSEVANACA
jgi:hypothetical protein